SAIRSCRSRPLRSGRLKSRIKQLGTGARGRERNSCAEVNVSARQLSAPISSSSDSLTETSSSTTNTIGVGGGVGSVIVFTEASSFPRQRDVERFTQLCVTEWF